MSLVAYDDSASSDYEEDDQDYSVVTSNKPTSIHVVPRPTTSNSSLKIENETEADGSLFIDLPKPTHKANSKIVEEEDEFLHKKDTISNIIKPKSKITVPSLSDFKDVANIVPTTKPKAVNGKKSGLLSILPQPKNRILSITTKPLIPHVVTQNSSNTNIQKKESTQTGSKKAKHEKNRLLNDNSDDSDNDDQVHNDFFSINKPNDMLDTELNSTVEEIRPASNGTEVRSIESYFKKDIEDFEQMEPGQNEAEIDYSMASSAKAPETENEVVLDDEAILKLVGARGKRKMEEIQIVDFNQQEVLAEARQLLLKGLMEDTSKRVSASKKRGNEPTHMQKRKHQITYLAHQAKANEVELQNKWASNRMSKRQSQSKYGF